MITQALQDKVPPAMGAMHTHYGMQFQAHRQRIESLEQEVQKLKIRTAWVEKDVMYQQIEVAKRTLVLRGFPDWMSHADRELTVDQAVREAGLISILTVPTFGIRKKLLDHGSRQEKISATTTNEGGDLSTITGFDQRVEKGSGQGESQPADGKGKDSQSPSQPTSTWFWELQCMESYIPGATTPSQAQRTIQKTRFTLYNCQRSTKTSSYLPGGMCGMTSSNSRSIKRRWSSRRLRQPHSPPHRTMLQQFASPDSSQGASLPRMQGKSRVSTTGWLVLSMSTHGSSTSPSCLANTLIVSTSQTCEMLRSS